MDYAISVFLRLIWFPPIFPFFRWRGGLYGKPCSCPSPAPCSASSLLFPLSILGTRNLFPTVLSSLARFVAAGVRTIPVLLWAIIFVILFGLGPLAGTFGIAAYTIGYLAKIYSDLFEGTDPEVLEAVGSTGASKLQLVRFVFLPEGANAILTQLLFMLEYNIRASSILGFVGAGGLGFVMQVYLQTLEYRRLASVLLLILVVVLAMDGLSAWIRKRFLLTAQA